MSAVGPVGGEALVADRERVNTDRVALGGEAVRLRPRPRRNRVTPTGEIISTPLRGAWMGNRGILHEDQRIVRSHRSNLWITCRLEFRDRRVPQWAPGRYTVLFFQDEAVSLAAGHRPCSTCRRADYQRFREAWAEGNRVALPAATDLDRRLHSERLFRGSSQRRYHMTPWVEVPAGAFVLVDSEPLLVLNDAVAGWSPEGYGRRRNRPRTGMVELITPPSIMAAIVAGYSPQIDPSA